MSAPPALSVVMATYNRADTLTETIRHLTDQDLDPQAFEVIIADDASPDETCAVVERAIARVPFHLKLLRNDRNRGPGYTENRGIREARAPLILLMADDIWMVRGALRAHLEFHRRHPEPWLAAMGCVLQSPRLNDTVFLRKWDPFRFREIGEATELPYYRFWANNVSVKRAFLLEHGLFREPRGRGGAPAHEDAELGYRLHKAGMKIVYNPSALGYHYHHVTLQGATKRWYERGLNWGALWKLVPEPEIPVIYHVLTWRTLGDHVRALFGSRRSYLMPHNRNVAALLLGHLARAVGFNAVTVKHFWWPLLERAESSPLLARFMSARLYRLFLYYHFIKGVRDAPTVLEQ